MTIQTVVAPLAEVPLELVANDPAHRVFVYGTLKRGFSNAHVMERAKGTFLTDARVRMARMYDLGYYPGVKLEGTINDMVTGEIYEVSPEGLATLDRLEGHPTHYRRTRTEVRVAGTDWPSPCWIYEFPHVVDARSVVPTGTWTDDWDT